MSYSRGRQWTSQEDDVIRAKYVSHGAASVAWQLSRTVSSVNHRSARLGVLRSRRWTAREDERLRMEWAEHTPTELEKNFGRTWAAIYWRAGKLDLPRGCSGGFERFGDAVKRTGFCASTLRKILRWGGVQVRRTKSRSAMVPGQLFTLGEVVPFDVDAAIDRWMATETAEGAAKARGLVGCTLREWLREAAQNGVALPSEPRRKKAHWRVPAVTIDQVVADHAETASVRAHALRLGVSIYSVRTSLYEAGVLRGTSKVWRLPASVVEAALRAAAARHRRAA